MSKRKHMINVAW